MTEEESELFEELFEKTEKLIAAALRMREHLYTVGIGPIDELHFGDESDPAEAGQAYLDLLACARASSAAYDEWEYYTGAR